MSFFGRTFIVLALFAGAVHVFRRDITRVVGVLKKPTENFIKEVKNELETTSKTTSGILGKDTVTNGLKEQQQAAQEAADTVKTSTNTNPKNNNPPELK
jgi:hypothetical protein